MKPDLQKEHQWLEQLVGEWAYELDAETKPGEPAVKHTGTESVRSLGGAWIVCEGRGQMGDAGMTTTVMTLGYDPGRKRYVGTFIGSMMTYLWLYEGEMDSTGTVLTLDAEGPSFTTPGKMAKYKDRIEIKGPDYRLLSSTFLGEDGEWHDFMKAHYRRTT